jgi:hypothetical protein
MSALMANFGINAVGGLIGWRWVTPINPEGDAVLSICPACGEVMEIARPGMLLCPCGVHLELGE